MPVQPSPDQIAAVGAALQAFAPDRMADPEELLAALLTYTAYTDPTGKQYIGALARAIAQHISDTTPDTDDGAQAPAGAAALEHLTGTLAGLTMYQTRHMPGGDPHHILRRAQQTYDQEIDEIENHQP